MSNGSGHGPVSIGTRLALLTWALAAGAMAEAPAPDLDHRYPKGSITTQAQADQALADAAAAERALDKAFATERARCARVFLATECLDKARRVHTLGRTQTHRIEVEAHDLQRLLAANQREAHRDVERAREHEEDVRRPDKEHQGQMASQKRLEGAEQRNQEALRQEEQAAASRLRFEQRNNQHDLDEAKRADVQLRSAPENARRFQDKQVRAKAYAADRARERTENEKVRADRELGRKKKLAPADGAEGATDPPK